MTRAATPARTHAATPEQPPTSQSSSSQERYIEDRRRDKTGLADRIMRRRKTPRQLVVYGAAAVLLILAEPSVSAFIAGASIVLLGLALRIWTFGHLQKDHVLVTTGPYAYTRNPAYVGTALIILGMVIAASDYNDWLDYAVLCAGLAGLAVFFMFYLPRKYSREYGRLMQLFPREFPRHAAHVPHFFPRPTPWRSGDKRRFSWRCVRANNELVWPLVCAVALALMWVGG